MFQLDFSHADIPAALAVLAASTVPLIGLSILTAVLPLLSPQKGEQMSIALQGFLLLVSGVYYPLSVLPLPFQLAGAISPLTYALAGIRHSLLDGAGVTSELGTIATLLAKRRSIEAQLERLTPREKEVLRLMAEGYASRAIAAELGISYTTIRTHIRSLGSKLAVHSKLEAIVKARELGLIS